MKKKLTVLLIVAMLCASLSGCQTRKTSIATTIYPVKYIIEQLAGSRVTVEYISNDNYISRTGLVSNYKDILERCSLFVYIGELEPYIDIFEQEIQAIDIDIINLASLSAIDNFSRFTTTTTDSGVTVITESKYYNSPLFDLVDIYKKDPYIWLDPIAMASMASTIKDWLESYYPEDTLMIENNWKTLQANLVRLDVEYQSLKAMKDLKIVTVTPSFGNWQKSYGIKVYPLILSKYGVLPNEEQLAFIEKEIQDNKVKYIVYDETLPEDMLELYERVKTDLKLTEINMSSLSRLSQKNIDSSMDYMTIMYQNLRALDDAFE